MKKIICAPSIFNTNKKLSDRINHFFAAMEEAYGYKTIYSDHIIGEAKTADLLFIYAGYHGHQLLKESTYLTKPKITYYLTGPHSFTKELITTVAERADLIIVTYLHAFRQRFPQLKKIKFLPLYFAPHSRYVTLKQRKRPKMKCLLTGHHNPKLYPLRHKIAKSLKASTRNRHLIDIMRHPRWTRPTSLNPWEIPPALNDSYAKKLNHYFCSIATDSIYHYGLAKYFEIPAAGCLLLGVRTPDIDEAGLEPWSHYIPISDLNIFPQIEAVFEEPDAFRKIKKQGCTYVRQNHSVKNRIKQLRSLMREVL